MQRVFLCAIAFSVLLASASVLAAMNCNPPGSGSWNITDITVICDNGTAITITGDVNITNSNVTFTNATNLTATGINLTDAVSVLIINNSALNGSLYLANGTVLLNNSARLVGNVTIRAGILTVADTSILSSAPVLTGGTFSLDNVTLAITGFNPVGAAAVTANDAILNLSGDLLLSGAATATFTNSTLLSTGDIRLENTATFTATRSAFNSSLYANGTSTVSISDTVFSVGSSEVIQAYATTGDNRVNVTLDNVTTNHALNLLRLDTAFLNGTFGTINLSLRNGVNKVDINDSNITLLALSLYDRGFESSGLKEGTIMTTSITENSMPVLRLGNTRATGIAVTAATSTNFTSSDHNLTIGNGTFLLQDSTFGTLTLHSPTTTMTLDLNNVNVTTLDNQQVADATVTAQNLNVTTTELAYNATWTFTGRNNDLNDVTIGVAGVSANNRLVLQGNVTFTDSSPVAFLGAQRLVRVYPVTLLEDSNPVSSVNVTVVDTLGGASTWTGISDAAGKVDANASWNSSNYTTTKYLFLPNLNGQNDAITLMTDTPFNWSIQGSAPFIELNATNASIGIDTFGFNASFSTDATSVNLTIGNGTAVWSNRSWNTTQLNDTGYLLTQGFDGRFLPAGNWTLNLTVGNGTATRSETVVWESIPAMKSSVTSSASQSATIGGANITFTFNVSAKSAGSTVKAFLALSNGGNTFLPAYARLSDGSKTVTVSGSVDYSGNPGNVTIDDIAAVPSYVTMPLADVAAQIKNEQLTLTIQPYEGLVPGTYTGSYGFGIFG